MEGDKLSCFVGYSVQPITQNLNLFTFKSLKSHNSNEKFLNNALEKINKMANTYLISERNKAIISDSMFKG